MYSQKMIKRTTRHRRHPLGPAVSWRSEVLSLQKDPDILRIAHRTAVAAQKHFELFLTDGVIL